MSDLSEQVTQALNLHGDNFSGQVVTATEQVFPEGFEAGRDYYRRQVQVQVRHGYRHFAGSELPDGADELIEVTQPVMLTKFITLVLEAFADGVFLGQNTDLQTRMALHFDIPDRLFHNAEYREKVTLMATGFAGDTEVLDVFGHYCQGALKHMMHITGFAHVKPIKPAKVWDLWMLYGTAVATTGLLAGHKMGVTWKERDVLDGIEIASEEQP